MTRRHTAWLAASLPLLGLVLVGCGSSGSAKGPGPSAPSETTVPGSVSTSAVTTTDPPPSDSTPAPPGQVDIVDFDFSPGSITVKAGDTVTWIDHDTADHWVVSAPASPAAFDLGRQGTDASVSHVFATAGTYPYFCNLHNYMKGTVVVQ